MVSLIRVGNNRIARGLEDRRLRGWNSCESAEVCDDGFTDACGSCTRTAARLAPVSFVATVRSVRNVKYDDGYTDAWDM